MSQEKPKHCTRCGVRTDTLYKDEHKNADGESRTDWLCWGCDWDLMNGGDPDADSFDIQSDREEENYAYDPINHPRPY